MAPFARKLSPGRAFTVLELMTAMVVIAILVVILLPVLSLFRTRAQKAKCIGNLHGLHVAVNTYVQDNRHWPQIVTKGVSSTDVATAWITTLSPYGLQQINWVCPTVQELLHSPDLGDPLNARIDYTPNPYDSNPTSPFRWAKQPWFAEVANAHGNGQEIIFPDGHIEEAYDLMRQMQNTSKAPAP